MAILNREITISEQELYCRVEALLKIIEQQVEQYTELAQEHDKYKERSEAMTRQLAKRHNQLHELTKQVKDLTERNREQHVASLLGQRDRALRQVHLLTLQCDKSIAEVSSLRAIINKKSFNTN